MAFFVAFLALPNSEQVIDEHLNHQHLSVFVWSVEAQIRARCSPAFCGIDVFFFFFLSSQSTFLVSVCDHIHGQNVREVGGYSENIKGLHWGQIPKVSGFLLPANLLLAFLSSFSFPLWKFGASFVKHRKEMVTKIKNLWNSFSLTDGCFIFAVPKRFFLLWKNGMFRWKKETEN